MSVSDLARLERQLDIEAIRVLKSRYCHWSDRGYEGAGDSPREVASLFTEHGVWGDTEGRGAIERLFEGFQTSLPFAMHLAVNGLIEVDGDCATGRWSGVIPATTAAGEPQWIAGVYEDELVRCTRTGGGSNG